MTGEDYRLEGFMGAIWAGQHRTFVPNPYDIGSDPFEHWRDGYEMGLMEANGVLFAANDNPGGRDSICVGLR